MATGLFALGSQDPQQQQTMTAQQPGGLYALGGGATTSGSMTFDPTFKDMGKQALNGANNLQGPNYSGLNPLNPGGYTENRNQATATAQNYFNNQLNDRYKAADNDFAQKMANQGIDAGSEAYKRNEKLYADDKNRAYQDAAFQAYQAGGLEQQQAFNQNFQTRQQGANEADNTANFGLGKFNSTLSGLGQFAGQENQANMQNSQQGWQSGESGLDRAQQTTLQNTQNKFEGTEGALDRQSAQNIAGNNNALALQILAQLGLSPAAGGGGGSPIAK